MSNQFSSIVRNPEPEQSAATQRFSLAKWFDFVGHQNVEVIGAGGIGSWLALMLARLNVQEISIIDPDNFDDVNMAGQLLRQRDIGTPKVRAVKDILSEYASYNAVSTFGARFSSGDGCKPIVFCGVDNMIARRDVFYSWMNLWKTYHKSKLLFIDGRLSAEMLQVFCISGGDGYYAKEYEDKWLFSDEEAESTVCSYKQTSYCANLIASLMTNLFVNWCTNRCNPIIDRSLPFMTEYNAEQMYLKTLV